MNSTLKKQLLNTDVDRDLFPHLRNLSGKLLWSGPMDRNNKAPIASTPCGLKLPVIQLIGLFYELGISPFPLATYLHAKGGAGKLRRFGAFSRIVSSRVVDPRVRKFGVVSGKRNYGIPEDVKGGPLTERQRRILTVIRKGAKRAQVFARTSA